MLSCLFSPVSELQCTYALTDIILIPGLLCTVTIIANGEMCAHECGGEAKLL